MQKGIMSIHRGILCQLMVKHTHTHTHTVTHTHTHGKIISIERQLCLTRILTQWSGTLPGTGKSTIFSLLVE